MDSVGGKTQLSSLVSALVMLIVILFIGPLFKCLPKACLASVIVVALKGLLFQAKDAVKYWKFNKIEFVSKQIQSTYIFQTFAKIEVFDSKSHLKKYIILINITLPNLPSL